MKGEFTSLNLQIPARPAPSAMPPNPLSLSGLSEERLAVLRSKPAQDELQRRAKLLRESQRVPKFVFFLIEPQSGMLILLNQKTKRTVLLFSSPFLAHDYLEFSKMNVGVAGVPMESFAATARKWQSSGVDSFAVDRCPRCQVGVVLNPVQGVITWEQFLVTWSFERAIKNWRAEALIRKFLAVKGENMHAEKRATLEMLRDHVDCGVPYVHWLIALIAGIQNDEAGRLEATMRLERFGPNFKNKTSTLNKENAAEWGNLWGSAMVGLLATYGMLNLKQNPPVVPKPQKPPESEPT
jgi:hypothetical protein